MADTLTLPQQIDAQIRETGPISLSTYMGLALSHPRHGYYAAGRPIGAEGDFITDPEISQMFGEIVGFFGLIGAGRTELLRLIYGAARATGGEVIVDGDHASGSPAASIRRGVVLCPEDRKHDGILQGRSIEENITISTRRHFSPSIACAPVLRFSSSSPSISGAPRRDSPA